MTSHWVGNSLMKPIDFDKFFNIRFTFCELESSLNDDDAIEPSVIEADKTEVSVIVEVVKKDAYLNTERNKRGKIKISNQDEDNLE